MGMTKSAHQGWVNATLSDVLASLGGVIRVHQGDEPTGSEQLFAMKRAGYIVFDDKWVQKFAASDWESFSSWAITPKGAALTVQLGSLIYASTWDGGAQLAPELVKMVPATFLDILRIIVADIVDCFEKDADLASLIRHSYPKAFAVLCANAAVVFETPVDKLDNDTLFVELRRLSNDREGAAKVEAWAVAFDDDVASIEEQDMASAEDAAARGARYLKEFHAEVYNGEDPADETGIPPDVQLVLQLWLHQMAGN